MNPVHAFVSELKMLEATKDQRNERKGEEKILFFLLGGLWERSTLMCLPQQKSARVDKRLSKTKYAVALCESQQSWLIFTEETVKNSSSTS